MISRGILSSAKANFRALPAPIRRIILRVQDDLRHMLAERAVKFLDPKGKPHHLPGELIVTLTSYPPRYHCLRKTLVSLLMQDVRPDRIILWLADGPDSFPPADVLDLQSHGLEIRFCDDIRSYKKIIPALESFPSAYLVTADDDLYYEPGWLRKIIDGFVFGEKVIICRRAHRPKYNGMKLAPYTEWRHEFISDSIERCIFPTSGAGALYPPGSLAPEVVERDQFLNLCPFADDVWLFVMALRAGSRFRQVGGGFPQIAWGSSQATSLMQCNLGAAGNDLQLAQVLAQYVNDPIILDALNTLKL